jgi:hypothetical protein
VPRPFSPRQLLALDLAEARGFVNAPMLMVEYHDIKPRRGTVEEPEYGMFEQTPEIAAIRASCYNTLSSLCMRGLLTRIDMYKYVLSDQADIPDEEVVFDNSYYFSYSPEYGYERHKSFDQARNRAEEGRRACLTETHDARETLPACCYGKVIATAKSCNRIDVLGSLGWHFPSHPQI